MLTIIGPTACGKTKFAVRLAKELDGEILSGDSRQVYRRMDLGTGKDLGDYTIDGQQIPYHLIDIAEPGTKYNVYQYQRDFIAAYKDVTRRGKLPILCGGTGLYVESVIKGYRMSFVPEDKKLRTSLQDKTLEELTGILKSYKTLHNKTDVDTAQRAIRAIEIEEYYRTHPEAEETAEEGEDRKPIFQEIHEHNTVVGLMIDREVRRARITARLRQRLDEGMLDEIRRLISEGIPPQDLIYYGLEYKYLTLHVIGELSFDKMFRRLEIAIHQFAKRQMTWFRGMEKRGTHIHWLNALDEHDKNIQIVKELIQM
jgi:tRNA dimethylallyltransferase